MSEAKDREFKPTDEEIRSSIENFRIEPSAKVWRGMNRKLLWMEMTRFNFTNVPLFYRIAVPSMILLFLGLGIYLGRNDISNVNIPVASAPFVKDGAVSAEKPLQAEKNELPASEENSGRKALPQSGRAYRLQQMLRHLQELQRPHQFQKPLSYRLRHLHKFRPGGRFWL